ncbi:beta strand repeat-containing protein [Marinicella litoralis]|uniref:Putative Ig domain-containing protein n=1 Tax=Marinicella litoralis TaxID=644220 RepID=A0A4V6PXY7_9GAMM|nr:Ig-like domain-containing protein [Marinicella litoralis]TDR22421.1 putative Ig domain-containing protein [Marinicella litoralis]
MSYRSTALVCFGLLLFSVISQAQNRFYHVYVDNDANAATGCVVNLPDFSSTIEGVQSRLTITTDSALPPNIVSTQIHQCDGLNFNAGTASAAAALGLNTGDAGADVFEAAISTLDLSIHASGNALFYFVTESDTAGDVVLNHANGGPIILGFVFPVPAMGLLALTVLLLILLITVRRSLSRNITISMVLICVSTWVWAMNIIIDGQTTDWNGINPANTDPINDTSAPGSYADLTAVFLTKSSDDVFIRMDVLDVENQAPIANASSDTTLEDNAVTITVTGSDPEGSPITFSVDTAPANGSLGTFTVVNNTSSTIQYTPDPDFNGSDSFTFVANDGQINSAPATAAVTITPVNDMPSFTDGGDITVDENSGIYNNTWATDILAGPANESAQILTFNIVNVTNAGLFSTPPTVDANSGNLSFTPTTDVFGTSTVTINLMDDGLTANGGIDTSANITFDIVVEEVNDAPVLANIPDQTVDELTLLSFTATATDANVPAQNLTFSLGGTVPAGAAITTGGDFSWTPTEEQGSTGTFSFDVIVTDDGTNPDDLSDSQSINVTVNKVNSAPVLTAIGPQTVDELNNLSFNAAANDTDLPAQNLSFTLSGTVPSGATISNTGAFNWTPTEAQGGNAYTFDVVVTDDGVNPPNLFDSETINVTVNEVNSPPVLNPIGNTTFDEETLLSFNAMAVDTDNPAQTLTFTLAGAVPTGAVITTGGAFSWTPTEAQGPGVYSFNVVVTDNGSNPNNLSDFETISLTVNEVNVAPVANAQTTTTDDETPLTITLTGSDAEGSSLTFSIATSPATGSLGTITQLTTTSASVTYTPGAVGNNDFTFTVFDGELNSSPATVSLNVTSSNLPPVASDDSYDVTGNVGLTVPVAAGVVSNDNDPDLDTLTVTAFDASSAQGGAVSVNANGSFTYSPPVGYTGADSFAYTMSDGEFSDSATVSLTISDRLWFVDNSAGAAGNGTLTNPFSTLAEFDTVNGNAGIANPAAGECVFLNETGSGNYVGPVTLLPGQSMIGKASSVSAPALCGITLATHSTPLPAINGTAPTVTSASIGINLAADNTLRGFDVGDTTDTDLNASVNVGTLAISEMSLLGNGRALNLAAGGTLNVALDQLISFNGTNGINLSNVGGVFTVANGTTIDASATNGIYILNLAPGAVYNFGNTNVTNSGFNGIQIYADAGSNVIFNQLNISNPTNFAYFQFGGELNTSSGSINAPNSTAFDLENAIANVNLTTVSGNNNSGSGIKLDNNTGTINLGNGAVTSTGSGIVFDVGGAANASGGSAIITYNGDITSTGTGRSVQIEELTGGSITLNGTITESSNGIRIQGINNGAAASVNFAGNVTANTITNTAIDLGSAVGNTNGTINFTGVLDIDTTSGNGFNALNGGTVNVSGSSNTINTTTGTAINIQNTNIGASNLVFLSVSAGTTTNSAGAGINLNTTGTSGGLMITGTGTTAGSGGTIRNKSGANGNNSEGIGITLNNTSNVQLSNMQLNDFDNFAVRGISVNGFTMTDSIVSGISGNSSAVDEAAIKFTNLTGTSVFAGNNISGGFEDQVNIINDTGIANISVVDSANDAAVIGLDAVPTSNNGNDGLLVESQGAAMVTLTVAGVEFAGARGDMLQTNAINTSNQTILAQSNFFNNTHPNIVSGGGGITVSGGGATSGFTQGYDVEDSNFSGAVGNAVTVNYVSGSGTISGALSRNNVGLNDVAGSGSIEASGISVGASQMTQHNTTLDLNIIRGINGYSGIDTIANTDVNFNATITNNTVEQLAGFAFAAMTNLVGGVGTETGTACLDVRNNTFDASASPFAGNAVFKDQISGSANYNLPGYSGSASGEFAIACAAGTASVDTGLHHMGNGNTMINGAFSTYPTGVDASAVCGKTGIGTSCPP